MKRFVLLFSMGAALVAAPARADFTETFSKGSDDGDWHLTDDPYRMLQIEPSHGNPGAYLRGQVNDGAPVWYVPLEATDSHFVGNYANRPVGRVSCDIKIFSGIQTPQRAVTLVIQSTFGTGDFGQGVQAYFVGTDISKLPKGWRTYSFQISADSREIPAGWKVFRGDGSRGTAADWRALMRHVETIGFMLGKPGFAYPSLNIWDLGLDNVSISRSGAVGDE